MVRRSQPPFRSPRLGSFNQELFPTRQPPVRRGGLQGILQNFTNKQSLASMANKGVSGLSKTLGNVQQIIRVIHSAAPVIQQYGPMIKNLPAMYRMMKAMKDIDDDPESETEADDEEKAETTHSEEKTSTEMPVNTSHEVSSKNSKEEKETIQTQPAQNNLYGGHSPPKLFI